MEVSSTIVKQASQRLDTTLSLLKKSAQNDRSSVKLVEQAVQSGAKASTTATRGQNLDIIV